MPKLRNLNAVEIVKILELFGFVLVRITGSHHIMRRVVDEQQQTVVIPIHTNKDLSRGMRKKLFRDCCRYIPQEELEPHFYTE